MGIQKQSPVTEQIAFETTFLRLIISLINRTDDLEQLGDFLRLRDLIYSPGEFGHSNLTTAVVRRRSGRLFNELYNPPPPPGGDR